MHLKVWKKEKELLGLRSTHYSKNWNQYIPMLHTWGLDKWSY